VGSEVQVLPGPPYDGAARFRLRAFALCHRDARTRV
jgi:hypothetical protein